MFDITKEDLHDILKSAHVGKLQLPDFQRSYVWGEEDVKSLIASIAKGYPVGSLLTLQSGGAVEFKPRAIEGAPEPEKNLEELLLDGQQRITSLYQTLFSSEPVLTKTFKGVAVERHFFLDMEKAVSDSADINEAIVGVAADGVSRGVFGRDVLLDLSTIEKQFEQLMFPLAKTFDSKDWFFSFRKHWDEYGENRYDLENDFDRGVLTTIQTYKMPIIRLDKNNSREAVCLVFEKVNVGGKKLDAFELVTAIYAANNFDLRKDWMGAEKPKSSGRLKRIQGESAKRNIYKELASTDFLQACTVLHTREQRLKAEKAGRTGSDLPRISCQKESLLALPLISYKGHADAVEAGFIEAAAFFNGEKIIWYRDVPYPPLAVTLASVFAIMGQEAKTAAAKAKLRRWFWSIVLGEQYGSSTETKVARDVPQLVEWIRGGATMPRSVDEAIFQTDRLRSLRSRLSAAYKGVHALLMREGCLDFITGKPAEIMTFFDDKIDIHHVFPRDWCKKQGLQPQIFNSIVNKTPLSKASNIAIGGHAPSKYLQRIETKHGLTSQQLDDILRTHLIEPQFLRNDDFEGFFNARLTALATLIGNAMEKPVIAATDAGEPELDLDDGEEDNVEEEAA